MVWENTRSVTNGEPSEFLLFRALRLLPGEFFFSSYSSSFPEPHQILARASSVVSLCSSANTRPSFFSVPSSFTYTYDDRVTLVGNGKTGELFY